MVHLYYYVYWLKSVDRTKQKTNKLPLKPHTVFSEPMVITKIHIIRLYERKMTNLTLEHGNVYRLNIYLYSITSTSA